MNFTTVVVVFTIFGCGTNLFAFLLLATTKMLKDETYNIFLINLCIGDVAYLVTNTMYRASTVDDEYTWPDVLCPLLSYARRGTFYLPIFVYCSLAVERYANAIHRFKLKCRPAIICNVILWAFAFTMALPYYLSYRTELSETKMTTTSMMNASCHTNETQVQQTLKKCARDADAPLWKEYQWAEMVVSYILPIAVCSIFYLRIWWCFRELNMALKDTMLTIISPSIIRGTQAQMEVRKGILKVLALATFIFFVCYTPVFLSILNYL
ncbi:7 transmembrane receptor (rhodopsin family) domain-containing protein [Ditylenchus destructor]|nr:7 transmembrane receptor (rhodopsin family) domain-containing protein [Ditylenchus destructor]